MRRYLFIAMAGLGIASVPAGPVRAQSLAELGAATSIQGTLAGNAASGVAGTLNTVKRSLAASTATTNNAWKTAAALGDSAGAGGTTKGWATASAASPGTTGGHGWVTAATNTPSGGNSNGWVHGGNDATRSPIRR
jgi:hypothetical protein